MIKIGFCPKCFDLIYKKNRNLYFHLISWIDIYVGLGCKPINISDHIKVDFSEEFKILEQLGYLVTHEDDQGILIKPLGLEIGEDGLHWFCLKNHLQDDEKENDNDFNN